jgi:hypothetical protein
MPERVLDEALLYVEEGSDEPAATAVSADLKYRAEVGRSKYGTYLTTDNGRDALVDLYEELLDAYMYSVQYQMENRSDFSASVAGDLAALCVDVAHAILNRNSGGGILPGRRPEPQPSLFPTDWEVIQ